MSGYSMMTRDCRLSWTYTTSLSGMSSMRRCSRQVVVSAVVRGSIIRQLLIAMNGVVAKLIAAKEHHVPLVIADCIDDEDERGFPYLGNVPTVRLDPRSTDRFSRVVNWLLDEILRDFLHVRCRTRAERARRVTDDIVFLPRSPELISLHSLTSFKSKAAVVVYPEPPLGIEEVELFTAIAPKVRILSILQWLAEVSS